MVCIYEQCKMVLADKTKANERVLSAMTASEPDGQFVLNTPHVTRLCKTLLQGGHFSQTAGTVQVSPHFDAFAFACAFIERLGKDGLVSLVTGGACFLVVELLQTLQSGANTEALATLKSWFDPELCTKIRESGSKGHSLLLEKVQAWQ
jgi:pumilio family protein 6